MSHYQKFLESPDRSPFAPVNQQCVSHLQNISGNSNNTPRLRISSATTSVARQQAQAHIERVMSRIRNGSAALKQQTAMHHHQQQHLRFLNSSSPSSLLSSGGRQYKRLVEQSNYQQPTIKCSRRQDDPIEAIMRNLDTRDPILLNWLRDIRFEPELEPLALQAKTCAHDEHSSNALSIRYSQVSVQRMRQESKMILDAVDDLIDALPLDRNTIIKFYVQFSDLYAKIIKQTGEKTNTLKQQTTINSNNQLSITFSTPKKSQSVVKTLRPLDRLTVQIRDLCLACASMLCSHQESNSSSIDNCMLESQLRKLKELYNRFVETSIKADCKNIVAGLQFDFSLMSMSRQSSNSSVVKPVKPFESSQCQLPLKWALIALWQLTKDDNYLCRTLTERWNHTSVLSFDDEKPLVRPLIQQSSPSKRLDYSTKYDNSQQQQENHKPSSTRLTHSDYHKLCELTNQAHAQPSGALKSALKSKEPAKEATTIELLIEIIISQPNKHERLDMLNYLHTADYSNQEQLIHLEEWDESVSAAIYTSNQYKVAALRILNQLCVNEQAVKTILKCFSTPPAAPGKPAPENKIIRSIFECYQTNQEHIYQNEPMFETLLARRQQNLTRKRCRKEPDTYSDYSDYGSKGPISSSATGDFEDIDIADSDTSEIEKLQEADDAVVREAIRLIVQLTSSFHRTTQGPDFYTLIGRFSIESLAKYLTNIIKSNPNREMLLLCLSALANISFITTEPMKLFSTCRVVLDMFRNNKQRAKDLDLRDQAVTLLANMASKNLMDIISNGGLSFLLSSLESCPTRMANHRHPVNADDDKYNDDDDDDDVFDLNEPNLVQELTIQPVGNIEKRPRRDRKPIDLGDKFVDILDCVCEHSTSKLTPVGSCITRLTKSQLSAMERIHQKTAVAFARMSIEPSITRMILKRGGVKQLIDLCKFGQKRNFSDTVLIACVAALQKMAKVIERDTFKYYNALDLIELEFSRILQIYGNPREDIVYASDV